MSAIFLIAVLGSIGGFINCVISGELRSPEYDRESRVWRPGWVGNVLVGIVAAVTIWALYGPLSNYTIGQTETDAAITLKLSELFGSVLIGMSGGHILSQYAKHHADQITKKELVKVITALNSRGEQR